MLLLDELDEDELDEDELDEDELDELLEQGVAGFVLLSRQKGSFHSVLLLMHPHSTDSMQASQVLFVPSCPAQFISADLSAKLNSLHPQSSSVPL